jgi:hypothetical protein
VVLRRVVLSGRQAENLRVDETAAPAMSLHRRYKRETAMKPRHVAAAAAAGLIVLAGPAAAQNTAGPTVVTPPPPPTTSQPSPPATTAPPATSEPAEPEPPSVVVVPQAAPPPAIEPVPINPDVAYPNGFADPADPFANDMSLSYRQERGFDWGLLGLLGLFGLIPLFRRGGRYVRTVYVDRDEPKRVIREETHEE